MIEPWLWKNMLANKVLLFGGNSVPCANSIYNIQDFYNYDFIGAPWKAMNGVGGDGALSFRNRSLMVNILNDLHKNPSRVKNINNREEVIILKEINEMQKDLTNNWISVAQVQVSDRILKRRIVMLIDLCLQL